MTTTKPTLVLALVILATILTGCTGTTNDTPTNCDAEVRYLAENVDMLNGLGRSATRASETLRDYNDGYQTQSETLDDLRFEQRVVDDILDQWYDNAVPDERYRDMDNALGDALINYETALDYAYDGVRDNDSYDMEQAGRYAEDAREDMDHMRRLMPDQAYCL